MLSVKENINLSQHSTFRVGGPARFFVQVSSAEELKKALLFAQEKKIKSFIFGAGSNVIFSDHGFDGLVIKLSGKQIEFENEKIISWAGTNLWDLVNFFRDNSLAGLEGLSGVPGTVGGAIFGNAGAFETEISDLLVEVAAFDLEKQRLVHFSKEKCVFKYRSSIFKEKENLVILSAIFNLKKGDQKEIDKKMKVINDLRGNKQPKDWIGSTGSFFKNPQTKNQKIINQFEEEKKIKIKNDKIPAGWLIEKAGLLGKTIGGAKISEKNGNFIINTGKATAQDVVIILSLIKQKIRNKFNIQLQEEVQLIGF